MHERPAGALRLSLMLELYPLLPANVMVVVPEDPVWKLKDAIEFIVKLGRVDESQMLLSTIAKANADELVS